MSSTDFTPPANLIDHHPGRGAWQTVGLPPPRQMTVQVLLTDGTTNIARWTGPDWWAIGGLAAPALAWRPMD